MATVATKRDNGPDWHDWHLPLSQGHATLGEGQASLARVGAAQGDIPFIIQLLENPRFDIPGLDVFHGAVDLAHHDAIHLLLGRGLLPKDEAFVIGFTMGSTRKVTTAEEKLFSLIASRVYPGIYRFDEDDVRVFRDAIRLAWVSECRRLDKVPFERHGDVPLVELRRMLRIEEDLLRSYYAIETRRFPASRESRRLLD
jgi:hypothetical protein